MPAHVKQNYGPEHKAQRRAWAPIVATGGVVCARYDTGECLEADPLILMGQRWDLDHVDGGLRPAHRRCNRSAGAAYGNRLREPRTNIW